MKQQKKNKLIFGLLMAMAVGIYLWYYPLDRGSVSVSVGLPDYLLIGISQTVQCPTDPCLFSQKTGTIELKIQKDGYFPETAKVKIKRFRTETLAVQLKKVPTLKESLVAPAESPSMENRPLPDNLDPTSISAFVWDTKRERLAYLDKSDEKVKIWSGGTAKVITPLKNIKEGFGLLWSPNATLLAGLMGDELYFIDTQKASRKKIMVGFEPQGTLWGLNGETLLVNESQDKVYKLDPQENKPIPISLKADLRNAAWDPNGKLIYFLVDEKANQTKVFVYDPVTDESTEIISKYNFPVSKITRDVNGTIYFYNTNLKNWSTLEY
jgi:hypothetical protein